MHDPINRNSVLNELQYFHVCNGGLLPDIMHDVLEGALQYEVKLMLQWMIESACFFTLDDLNCRLENLELGHMETASRPSLISGKTLTTEGIVASRFIILLASQMWLLGRILPIVIGEFVPQQDEHWELFLTMMEIIDLLFAPTTTADHAAYLAL